MACRAHGMAPEDLLTCDAYDRPTAVVPLFHIIAHEHGMLQHLLDEHVDINAPHLRTEHYQV